MFHQATTPLRSSDCSSYPRYFSSFQKHYCFPIFITNKPLHNIASYDCLNLADFVSPAIGNNDLLILFLVILQPSEKYSGTK